MSQKRIVLHLFRTSWLFVSLIAFFGCASPRFSAIPPDLDRSAVLHQTLEMKAKRFEFTPELIRVKAGTLLQLKIQSTEGTHGFRLSDFGINVRLNENEEQIVEVYLPKAGEYSFRCSHFCGLGHLGMSGTIIVE